MSIVFDSTPKKQDTKLTRIQRATIDRLLATYPTITPQSVQTHYDHYCFSRNWYVCIEHDPDAYHKLFTITRCDHSWTAAMKAQAIRRYIESKQGGTE